MEGDAKRDEQSGDELEMTMRLTTYLNTATGTFYPTWNHLARSVKYHHREPGFFRMCFCGWRLVAIDTRKHRACYTDRTHGWKIGPLIFRFHRQTRIRVTKISAKSVDGSPGQFATKVNYSQFGF